MIESDLKITPAGSTRKKRAGNLASGVYDQIRSDILNGVLQPGTHLSQLAIAKASGTSHGPVREALRRLQQDQLVIARANQRFTVAPLDVGDLEEILSLHLINVTSAIRVSVPLMTDSELEQFSRYIEQIESTSPINEENREAVFREFTLALVCHAGPRTLSFIDHLIDNIQRHRKKTLNSLPTVSLGGGDFQEIAQAVRARDGKLASTHFARYAGRLSILILAGAAPEYNASRLREYVQYLNSSGGS